MKRAIVRICQRIGILPQRGFRIEHLDNYSPQLGRNVKVDIYLPSDFQKESNTQYNILYINDGQDLVRMNFKSIIEELWKEHSIQRLIVIAIYANERRMNEYGTANRLDYKGRGSLADDYTRFITRELVPFMRDYYKLRNRVLQRAYAGFSLGGLSAFDIVWHNADLFQKAGVFSGSFWWRSQAINQNPDPDANRIMHDTLAASEIKYGLKFWLQTGTEDEREDRNNNGIIDSIDDTMDIIKALKNLGYQDHDITYLEVDGGQHNPKTWSMVMPDFLTWAFGH